MLRETKTLSDEYKSGKRVNVEDLLPCCQVTNRMGPAISTKVAG